MTNKLSELMNYIKQYIKQIKQIKKFFRFLKEEGCYHKYIHYFEWYNKIKYHRFSNFIEFYKDSKYSELITYAFDFYHTKEPYTWRVINSHWQTYKYRKNV